MFFRRRAGHKYIDRGDVAAVDFPVTDFVTDGNWHDLDLSAKIGKGVKLVRFYFFAFSEMGIVILELKQGGNANDFNIDALQAPEQGVPLRGSVTASTNAAGIVQYKLPDITYIYLFANIQGYFEK